MSCMDQALLVMLIYSCSKQIQSHLFNFMFVSFTLPQLAPQPASAWTHSSAGGAIACEHAPKWGIGRREKSASQTWSGGKKERTNSWLNSVLGLGFDSRRGRRFFFFALVCSLISFLGLMLRKNPRSHLSTLTYTAELILWSVIYFIKRVLAMITVKISFCFLGAAHGVDSSEVAFKLAAIGAMREGKSQPHWWIEGG